MIYLEALFPKGTTVVENPKRSLQGGVIFLHQNSTPPLCMINTIFFLTSLVVIWPLLNAGEKRVQWIEMALKHFKCVELAVLFKSLFLFYSYYQVSKQPCYILQYILLKISSKLSNITIYFFHIRFLWILLHLVQFIPWFI